MGERLAQQLLSTPVQLSVPNEQEPANFQHMILDMAVERDSLTERRAMDDATRRRVSCW